MQLSEVAGYRPACATQRATGDLGVIIERALGSVQTAHIVSVALETLAICRTRRWCIRATQMLRLRFRGVWWLTKIDMLGNKIVKRVMQSGTIAVRLTRGAGLRFPIMTAGGAYLR